MGWLANASLDRWARFDGVGAIACIAYHVRSIAFFPTLVCLIGRRECWDRGLRRKTTCMRKFVRSTQHAGARGMQTTEARVC